MCVLRVAIAAAAFVFSFLFSYVTSRPIGRRMEGGRSSEEVKPPARSQGEWLNFEWGGTKRKQEKKHERKKKKVLKYFLMCVKKKHKCQKSKKLQEASKVIKI